MPHLGKWLLSRRRPSRRLERRAALRRERQGERQGEQRRRMRSQRPRLKDSGLLWVPSVLLAVHLCLFRFSLPRGVLVAPWSAPTTTSIVTSVSHKFVETVTIPGLS